MLPQEAMIERVRELCHRDERLVSALMYGSFAIGEGDRFSEIEFYLFFAEGPPKACRRKRGSL
jgi:lincosamide nucleotidyltransferase